MACSENENSNRYEELNIRKDFYDAIVSGYTEVLNGQLTFRRKIYSSFRVINDLYAGIAFSN